MSLSPYARTLIWTSFLGLMTQSLVLKLYLMNKCFGAEAVAQFIECWSRLHQVQSPAPHRPGMVVHEGLFPTCSSEKKKRL